MFSRTVTNNVNGATLEVSRTTADGLIWITTTNSMQYHTIGLPPDAAMDLVFAIVEANEWPDNG